MKNYDYILFDLDGTITDSKPGIVTCIRYALDSKGISCPDSILDKMVGPPFRVSMREFLGLDMPMIEQLITLYRGVYETDGWKMCEIYSGILEMFEKLKAAGKHLAVATSKPMKFTNLMIDGLGIRKYFDFVGGASSDASKETKADVVQLVLDSLNITDRSKVLMVGDRLYDIEGAHACGVDAAGILWGYGDEEELCSFNAEYIVDTPESLTSQIIGK